MVQDEIFRFMNLRPVQKAQRVSKNFASFPLKKKPSFQDAVEKLSGDNAYARSLDLARAQLGAARPDDKGINLEQIINNASAARTVLKAKEAVKADAGMDIDALLKDQSLVALCEWYWNALLAHSLLPSEDPGRRAEIYEGIRAFHFLFYLAQQAPGEVPLDRAALDRIRPLLPPTIFLNPASGSDSKDPEGFQDVKDRWEIARGAFEKLTTAIEDIRKGDRIVSARRRAEIKKWTESGKGMAGIPLSPVKQEDGTGPSTPGRPVIQTRSFRQRETVSGAIREETRSDSDSQEIAATQDSFALYMVREKPDNWLNSDDADNPLMPEVRKLVKDRMRTNGDMNPGNLCRNLEAERYHAVSKFLDDMPSIMLGHVDKLADFRKVVASLAIPDHKFNVPYPKPVPDKTTPMGRGINPLGIGDLLVVKQKLMKYEAGEVAHVENVLKSEYKTRTHTRFDESESVDEKLEESGHVLEKDMQSTERYELRSETQNEIRDQTNVSAGASLSMDFGFLKLGGYADYAQSSSETESEKNAAAYAKDITQRAVARITGNVRERRQRRTLQRIEERNEHGFDNKDGAGHVIGVYRWLDKYYKARLINYGKRLMLSFIVPEPAAFFIHNLEKQEAAGIDVPRPRVPMINREILSPKLLTKQNYMDFVAKYNVQDIEPYPEDYLPVSMSFGEAASTMGNVDFAKTYDTWVVPEGYEVESIYGGACALGYPPHHVSYGFGGVGFDGPVAGLEGIISVSVSGFISAFQMNMVAVCRPTERAVASWQLKAYSAIMKAYQVQLSAYKEAVAAAEIQAGVKIEGRNPGINRKIEAEELRKGVLRMLTNDFARIKLEGQWRKNETFSAMKDGGRFGYPEFDIPEALIDGKIIQFFEQAIDWNNMAYFFYPYFWARMNKWAELFPVSDHDPLFTQFLRSGAARVVVPVQPEYTEVVLHYMATNELWNGGSPPTINDELYISIVDEMRAENGMSADDELPACSVGSGYPCLVDEWEVKLPTDLVYLQPDDSLPDFSA